MILSGVRCAVLALFFLASVASKHDGVPIEMSKDQIISPDRDQDFAIPPFDSGTEAPIVPLKDFAESDEDGAVNAPDFLNYEPVVVEEASGVVVDEVVSAALLKSELFSEDSDDQPEVVLEAPPIRPEFRCRNLSDAVIREIRSYRDTVELIIKYVNQSRKWETYHSLQHFTDEFGSRITGSGNLEESINHVIRIAQADGFNVSTENVTVPRWTRNSEYGFLMQPRFKKLNILGLGGSPATQKNGLEAEVVAVSSFEELKDMAQKVPGKIVLFNQPFKSYKQSVRYRVHGAAEASKLGAVAALVRSVTDFSINSPHTGSQSHQENVTRIPAASVTVEDANMIHRLYKSGKTVRVHLNMGAKNLAPSVSRNTIIDSPGTTTPEQFVVLSGHIDSWDVGAGAMDDAGGCFVSYHANLVLKQLGLIPKRTVRTIFFTGEEQGLYGGMDFLTRHKNDSNNYQLMMESDSGTFKPLGLGFTGSDTAACALKEILKLTASINTTQLIFPAKASDLMYWADLRVPLGSLHTENSRYFWFHHSEGDTTDVLDPDDLDRATSLWAAVAYVAADVSFTLGEL